MPKFVHCFYDKNTRRIGAVEIDCQKATSIMSPELTILAKSIAVKVLDTQLSDIEKLLEKNVQLKDKVTSTAKHLVDTILISKIWI